MGVELSGLDTLAAWANYQTECSSLVFGSGGRRGGTFVNKVRLPVVTFLCGAFAVLGLTAPQAFAASSGAGHVTDVSSACAGQNAEVEQAVAPRATSMRRGSDVAARASPGPWTAARTSPSRLPCPTPAAPTTRPSPSLRTGPCTCPTCATTTTTPTR